MLFRRISCAAKRIVRVYPRESAAKCFSIMNTQDKALDAQRGHWENTYIEDPTSFGEKPSLSGQRALQVFKAQGIEEILELGGGLGRDSLFFAQNGLRATVLDYSARGIEIIREKANTAGLADSITTVCHDIRQPLPFPDGRFSGAYSHMLYCMALATPQLEALCAEVKRVLKPGGLCVYTVRNTNDPHYRQGIHRGEDLWEVNGFIVHFFSKEKVQQLAQGWEIVNIEEFEEGALPRRLFAVTLRRPA